MFKSKINIIIPCAGKGTRLNLPYAKEIHRINRDTSLIDLSLNLCVNDKDIISEIIIVTDPSKKDLINYLNKWKKNFNIKICFFNHNFHEWAGSIMSAKNYFSQKNVVLLPDSLITQYKNQSTLRSMNVNLDKNDVCFALKKEKNKNKLLSVGALNVKNDKINNFCDKPEKNTMNIIVIGLLLALRKNLVLNCLNL